MNTQDFFQLVGVVVAILAALSPVLLLALKAWLSSYFAPMKPLYDEGGEPCWVHSRDIRGISDKIQGHHSLIVMRDDRLGKVESEISLITQEYRLSNQHVASELGRVADAMERVTDKLEEITKTQQQHALLLERNQRSA